MRQIALFGTSADPPTAGHQTILTWLSDRFDQVAVWASDNPFKGHQTPLVHRTAMLRILVETIRPQRQNLSVYESLSYPRTLMTLQQAQKWWQDAAFTFVVGSDLVKQLPRWYRAPEFLQQVNLLIVPRPGYPVTEADLEPLRQLSGAVAIAHIPVPAVSSSAYRQGGDSDIITPSIAAYIDREKLYQWQDEPQKNLVMQPQP